MKISDRMKIVKNLFLNNFAESIDYINNHINDSFYESFMAQKSLQKLYINTEFSSEQKREILQCLENNFPNYKQEIKKNYEFIETFFPIANRIYSEIYELIKSNFKGSLFTFSYCIGLYIQQNPDMIYTAKNLILSIATKALKNDFSFGELQAQIVLSESIYYKHKQTIETIYKKAIKHGVIQEKYDAICFCREKIESISINENVPLLTLKLSDPLFDMGLQKGVLYNSYLASKKEDEDPGYVHSYYKCKICRYSSLIGAPEDVKQYVYN